MNLINTKSAHRYLSVLSLILLLVTTNDVEAQSSIDSLSALVEQFPDRALWSNTELEILDEYTKQLVRQNHKDQVKYLSDYVHLAIDLEEYDLAVIKSRFIIQQHIYATDMNSAYELIDSMLVYEPFFQESKSKGHLLLKRAGLLFNEGKTTESIADFKESAELFLASGDSIFVADAYYFSGQAYSQLGNFIESILVLEKASALYEALEDDQYVMYTGFQIAYLMATAGLREEANRRNKELIKKHKGLQSNFLVSLYSNLAIYEKGQNNAGEARQYLDSAILALSTSNSLDPKEDRRRLYHTLMSFHVWQEDSDSSQYYYELAKQMDEQASEFYTNLLQIAKGQYWHFIGEEDLALEAGLSGLEHARNGNMFQWQLEGLELLADVYEAKGETQESMFYLRELNEIRDSLSQMSIANAYAYNQSRFQANEKEKEIVALGAELQGLEDARMISQLQMILAGVGIFFFAIIGIGYARFRVRKKSVESQKLKEIGQFKEAMTGMIAHDLKNPLGVIMGSESEKPSTRNMARQMLGLVNNMLDVQKFEKAEVNLKLESISLERIMVEAVEQVRMLLDEKNISIRYHLKEDTSIHADQEILMRVIINLLTNAIKYSPNNSIITLAAKWVDQQVEISIDDQGHGIPEDQLENIFGAYQQFDPKHSGAVGSTGLGLTFCKLALKAHGSNIQVSSQVGEGTQFSFTLGQGESVAGSDGVVTEKNWKLSEEDKAMILNLLPELQSYRIHHAMQMETLLEPVRNNSESTRQWVEAILNAAYNGNEEYFKELVDGVALRQAQDDIPSSF